MMNKMKNIRKISENTTFRLIIFVFFLFHIMICVSKFDSILSEHSKTEIENISLNDSWKININHEDYTNVALDRFSFPTVNTGDYIRITRTLSDYSSIDAPTMRLYTRHCSIQVFVDHSLIYSYGLKRAQDNLSVGGGYSFIPLPSYHPGSELTIKFYITENKAFSCFNEIDIYSGTDAHSLLMIENRIPLFLSCFLCIFGICTLILTLISYLFYRTTHSFFFISLFSIAIGTWSLGFYHGLDLFSVPLYILSTIEYISLYLMPIPLAFYLLPQVKKIDNFILTGAYKLMLLIMMITTTTVITLHFYNIVHLARVLPTMQILTIGYLCFAIILLIISFLKKDETSRLYLIGLLFVLLLSSYDLITYCLYRYFSLELKNVNGLTPLGMLVFIFITVISFLQQITKAKMAEAEQNSLRKSAYTDGMTQIYNRRYCSEYMTDAPMDRDYIVGCVDINNLKFANDTFGHAAGDKLIISTARILSETFNECGIVGRMGGDEFIFIANYKDKTQLNQLLETLIHKQKMLNISDPDLNLSIACGYVISCDYPDCNLEQLYNKADENMYIMKKDMKQAINDSTY